MMWRTPAIRLFLLGAVLLGAVSPAAAQRRLDLTPYLGVLVPTNDIVAAGGVSTGSPAAGHGADLVFGGRLTYWFDEAIGLEADVSLAPNALSSDAFGVAGSVDARFFSVNARLVQVFARDPGSPALRLTGGLGFIATSYDELEMTTGGLGVLGIGFRLPIGGLALQLDAEDHISTAEWRLADGEKTNREMQNDLRFSLGLVIPLVR
jgi:hypothetical protein